MNKLGLQKHLSYDIKENFNKSIQYSQGCIKQMLTL